MPDNTPPLVYVDLIQTANKGTKAGRPQRWRWIAKNGNNEKTLAKSSENYTNRQDCLDAIAQLFGAGTNVYLRQHETGNQVLRMADSNPL